MTVDSAGRSAAAALHRATDKDLEVHTMLDQLQHDSRRNKGIELAALVGAAALLVAVGWMFLRPADEATAIPGGAVFGASATAVDLGKCCTDVAAGDYLLPLEVPFTVSIPAGWSLGGQEESTERGRVWLDVDLRSPADTGVFVVMDPQGSLPTEGRVPDPSAGTTADSMATWLAQRPYLKTTDVVSTTVSDLPAWQVDVQLRDNVKPTMTCQPNILDCMPMVLLPFGENATGITNGQRGRMIFVEIPGDRVIWVYATGAGDLNTILDQAQPIIDSLDFDTAGL
ncbi:MAG TPA: hypothetical protein VES02_05935 [Dermatophilaceae bacterium]|nr:hypothetical protein [Dermatophilaceae bacterium]